MLIKKPILSVIAILGLIVILSFFQIDEMKLKAIDITFISQNLIPLLLLALLIEMVSDVGSDIAIKFKKEDAEDDKEEIYKAIQITFSILMALFGVTILDKIIDFDGLSFWKTQFVKGINILFSAGLLASGSEGVKNLIELLKSIIGGAIKKLNSIR